MTLGLCTVLESHFVTCSGYTRNGRTSTIMPPFYWSFSFVYFIHVPYLNISFPLFVWSGPLKIFSSYYTPLDEISLHLPSDRLPHHKLLFVRRNVSNPIVEGSLVSRSRSRHTRPHPLQSPLTFVEPCKTFDSLPYKKTS